jgi:hypothetical protein
MSCRIAYRVTAGSVNVDLVSIFGVTKSTDSWLFHWVFAFSHGVRFVRLCTCRIVVGGIPGDLRGRLAKWGTVLY